MNWYIAKIVFNITAENTKHSAQFDEQLRLISAENKEEAFHKARTIGLNDECAFLNDQHNKVQWEFINVSEIVPIGDLHDGSELYSSIHEPGEAGSYINIVHQKAIFIRTNLCEVN